MVDEMLNSDNTLFLDDMTPQQAQKALGMPLIVFRNRGEAFYQAMKQVLSGNYNDEVTYV